MSPRPYPAERIAAALLDAATVGDKAAARKHGMSARTLRRARAAARTAPGTALAVATPRGALAGATAAAVAAVGRTLAEERMALLKRAFQVLIVRINDRNLDVYALIKIIKVVGDLDIAYRMTVEREDWR